jgi:transposase-like protein
MVRSSTRFVSYQDLQQVCADLKAVYTAAREEAGRDALERFGEIWNTKYPMIYQSRDGAWNDRCEFFKYPAEIRRV